MDLHGEIPCYRVLSAAHPYSTDCMRLGWRTEVTGLFLPKIRMNCDVLHLTGEIPDDVVACAATVAEACREVGAKAIFWEPQAPSEHSERLLRHWREHFGLQIYSPKTFVGAVPVCTEPLVALPPAPFAVGITARTTITEIRGGHAVKRTANRGELEAILEKFHPEIAYSAELAADFFTLHTDDTTLFAVFDTEATLQKRIARAVAAGASAVFCNFCEKS
ncbi:MAG: hypothetical protein IKU55_01620 [Clostridia bacterium]|nr:hypothetical protein [Clostridia bacterium]